MILSAKGWARAAKGHDIDAAELAYRGDDAFLAAARGRSNDACVFFDSGGRAYVVPPHTLPSARGQGEPLTGRVRTPDGARFVGVALGDASARLLLASDWGYGFATTLGETLSKNRAGKAVLNVSTGAVALPPTLVGEAASHVAVATNRGRLLAFALEQVPVLARGKGQKLLGIPPKALREDEERVVGVVALGERDKLLVYAGARHLTLRFRELAGYLGARAGRGRMLPRGFQKVDRLAVASR